MVAHFNKKATDTELNFVEAMSEEEALGFPWEIWIFLTKEKTRRKREASQKQSKTVEIFKPEDHWSCIAHLSAEDMLKSAVIDEKKFKFRPWAGADNPSGPKFWCQQEGLITMVICCKFKKNLFNLWLYTHLFMI